MNDFQSVTRLQWVMRSIRKALYVQIFIYSQMAILLYPRPRKLEGGYTGFTLSVRPSVRPSVCRRHGFRSISQVCFGISISNFICMLMVAIGRSLLIFSVVTYKMAAFGFRTLTLVWLWISTSTFSGTILMYMGRSLLIFSNVIFKIAAWRPY